MGIGVRLQETLAEISGERSSEDRTDVTLEG